MRPAVTEMGERGGKEHGQTEHGDNRQPRGRARQPHQRQVARDRPRPWNVRVDAGDVNERPERQQPERHRQHNPEARRASSISIVGWLSLTHSN